MSPARKTWVATACAIGSLACMAAMVVSAACTPAQLAQVQAADKVATMVTGLACDVADVQPAGQPWTTFACDAVQATEGVVAAIPVPDAGPDAATVPPAQLVAGTILVPVPAAQVSAFLESHPRRAKKHDAGTTTVTVTAVDAGGG